MKPKQPSILEAEYAPKAANVTAQRHAAQQQRLNEERQKAAEPIQAEDLSDAVAELAATWGLKRKS